MMLHNIKYTQEIDRLQRPLHCLTSTYDEDKGVTEEDILLAPESELHDFTLTVCLWLTMWSPAVHCWLVSYTYCAEIKIGEDTLKSFTTMESFHVEGETDEENKNAMVTRTYNLPHVQLFRLKVLLTMDLPPLIYLRHLKLSHQ
jgi:hypothetical protein